MFTLILNKFYFFSQDYAMESGATRLFETRRLCATLEAKEKEDEAEAAKKNPMAALEKRTKVLCYIYALYNL